MRVARAKPTLIIALAAGCAAAIAGCGTSTRASTVAASPRYSAALRFSDCMRRHGVTSFPDPTGGGGIHIPDGSGINLFSPAFKAAQSACRHLLPAAAANQHPSAGQVAATRQVSDCMRRHGVTGFPDPVVKPPSSPAGYSILENRGGVILAVPNTIDPSAPTFERAAKVCHFS